MHIWTKTFSITRNHKQNNTYHQWNMSHNSHFFFPSRWSWGITASTRFTVLWWTQWIMFFTSSLLHVFSNNLFYSLHSQACLWKCICVIPRKKFSNFQQLLCISSISSKPWSFFIIRPYCFWKGNNPLLSSLRKKCLLTIQCNISWGTLLSKNEYI